MRCILAQRGATLSIQSDYTANPYVCIRTRVCTEPRGFDYHKALSLFVNDSIKLHGARLGALRLRGLRIASPQRARNVENVYHYAVAALLTRLS